MVIAKPSFGVRVLQLPQHLEVLMTNLAYTEIQLAEQIFYGSLSFPCVRCDDVRGGI